MKQKVLSLVLAAIMLSTSVDVTAFASQTSDVDSAAFTEEIAEETTKMQEELPEKGGEESQVTPEEVEEEEPQVTSEVVEEESEFSSRGGAN